MLAHGDMGGMCAMDRRRGGSDSGFALTFFCVWARAQARRIKACKLPPPVGSSSAHEYAPAPCPPTSPVPPRLCTPRL
eukprot:1323051-Prymnesium_polylepis.1